jgi:predicted nicotinamide N-methyase
MRFQAGRDGDRVIRWLRVLAGQGAVVLIGDPGRAYLPSAA